MRRSLVPRMTQPAAPRPTQPAASRLSIAQMLGVMRVEFHRARAQRQPMCCLMVAIDGIADMQKKGGFALKQEAMRTAYGYLKTVARERQCFGMSLLSGDRIMAVFPGTPPARLAEFGNALVEYARAHPIAYTGLYLDVPPAKPAPAAKPAAETAPAPAADEKPKAEVPADAAGEASEVEFDDDADSRLKSRASLLEVPKSDAAPKDEAPKTDESAKPEPEAKAEEAPKPADPAPAPRKPGEPVQVRLTLSLGASHNLLAETSSSFEGLVEKAGRALSMAREGSGDRYVMWREAEAEIQGLRDDLAAQRATFRQEEAILAEEASEIGGLQQAALVDRIQQIFAKVTRTPDLESVEKEIIAFAVEELYEGRRKAVEAQMAEHKRLVDQLERRVAKLTSLLGVTEEELQRVMSMKNIDDGVASIYRTVQGLAPSAAQAEQKRAMMSVIFNENLSFQKREAKAAEPARAA